MTSHASPDSPTEVEVRALVRRVVDGVFDAPTDQTEPRHESSSPSPQPAAPAAGSIAIGADHGGFPLKERISFRLRESGYAVTDCGTNSTDSVDYPDFALDVARRVSHGEVEVGILVDGAGIGSAIAANKVPGVRAALCYDLSTARNSREHNHANVLTLGAGLVGDALAWQIVEEFLSVPWGGGRHQRRVDKIIDIEQSYSGVSP